MKVLGNVDRDTRNKYFIFSADLDHYLDPGIFSWIFIIFNGSFQFSISECPYLISYLQILHNFLALSCLWLSLEYELMQVS